MFTKEQLRQVISEGVQNIETRVTILEKAIKIMKANINYIKKTLNIVVKNYDEGDHILGKRITKIENYLHFPQSV